MLLCDLIRKKNPFFYVHGDSIKVREIAQGKLNKGLAIFLQFLHSRGHLYFDPPLFTQIFSQLLCVPAFHFTCHIIL